MKKWLSAIIAAVVFGGCSTLQVQVDQDPNYNFSSLSTFAVVYSKKDDGRDFNRARIGKSLESYMQNKGYRSVDKNKADFYITMHLDIQKKSQIETDYETMGIRPRFYYNPELKRYMPERYYSRDRLGFEQDMRVTTRTYEYEEGTLVLEIFDVKDNSVIWQGIAKDELSTEYTAKEKNDYINSVIGELFKDFPSK